MPATRGLPDKELVISLLLVFTSMIVSSCASPFRPLTVPARPFVVEEDQGRKPELHIKVVPLSYKDFIVPVGAANRVAYLSMGTALVSSYEKVLGAVFKASSMPRYEKYAEYVAFVPLGALSLRVDYSPEEQQIGEEVRAQYRLSHQVVFFEKSSGRVLQDVYLKAESEETYVFSSPEDAISKAAAQAGLLIEKAALSLYETARKGSDQGLYPVW